MGNGARVVTLAIGSYDLAFPIGLVINLENIYFVPTISRNIISVSCLDKIGFSFIIKEKCCSIYLNELFFGSAQMNNGPYELDLETPIYNINAKKFKSLTYLYQIGRAHV